MTVKETTILCPVDGTNLIHVPDPIDGDIVICPECGGGGTYKEIVEERGNFISGYVALGALDKLLRKIGYPRK